MPFWNLECRHGEPWWAMVGARRGQKHGSAKCQVIPLTLSPLFCPSFCLIHCWVLINFYLRSATLTSTTLWNELRSSLWELEQRLLSRRATISRVCVEKEREADEQHERNWLIFIQRYFGQILELFEMTQWALNGFHRPPGRKTFPDHKRLNHWCT